MANRVVDYLPFATNVGSNVQGQSSYVIEPIRLTGNQAGVAKSAVNNKTLRQCSVMTAAIANMLSEAIDVDLIDDGDVAALTSLLQDVVLGGRAKYLTNDMNFYVSQSGSDSNDGLTPSTAWATIQHAADYIYYYYNLNGYNATVNVAAGTYAGASINNVIGMSLPFSFYVKGAGQGSTTVSAVDSSCFTGFESMFFVSDLRMTATGTGVLEGFCLAMSRFALYDRVTFGSAQQAHIWTNGGLIATDVDASHTYTIDDDSPYHVLTDSNGRHLHGGTVSVTLTGTPSFSGAFICALNGGFHNDTDLVTYTGAATGKRFLVDGTSSITTGSGAHAALTWLPGDAAGILRNWFNYNNMDPPTTTVGSLISAVGAKGLRCIVTDSNSATLDWGTVAAGGGNTIPVTSDGTNWKRG